VLARARTIDVGPLKIFTGERPPPLCDVPGPRARRPRVMLFNPLALARLSAG